MTDPSSEAAFCKHQAFITMFNAPLVKDHPSFKTTLLHYGQLLIRCSTGLSLNCIVFKVYILYKHVGVQEVKLHLSSYQESNPWPLTSAWQLFVLRDSACDLYIFIHSDMSQNIFELNLNLSLIHPFASVSGEVIKVILSVSCDSHVSPWQ